MLQNSLSINETKSILLVVYPFHNLFQQTLSVAMFKWIYRPLTNGLCTAVPENLHKKVGKMSQQLGNGNFSKAKRTCVIIAAHNIIRLFLSSSAIVGGLRHRTARRNYEQKVYSKSFRKKIIKILFRWNNLLCSCFVARTNSQVFIQQGMLFFSLISFP